MVICICREVSICNGAVGANDTQLADWASRLGEATEGMGNLLLQWESFVYAPRGARGGGGGGHGRKIGCICMEVSTGSKALEVNHPQLAD